MKVLDQHGAVLFDDNGTGGSKRNRPEIDRHRLREILLNSVDPASIKWGKKLLKVEPNAETKDTYDLYFADGVEYGFDLVVGADGAWSRVRPLLTDAKPYYSGITGVVVGYPDVINRKQEVAKLVGAGNCFAYGDNRRIASQRSGDGGVLTYAMIRVPETWGQDSGIDWTSPSAIQQVVDGYFNDWVPELKNLLLNGEDPLILRPLYMLPVGLEWNPRPGVTLLGDAAHLMTPFAGVGVNVAMTDALKLAKALISRRESWLNSAIFGDRASIAAATREYEVEMFPRAKENAEATWRRLEWQFSENPAPKVAEFFQKMASEQ
jgi:2-polyprenyl-6-methoxyphenol hydroxylase-like FAD-dependent oxidoreductase